MRARNEMILREEQAQLVNYQPAPIPIGAAALETSERSLVRAILRRFWLVVLFAGLGAGGAIYYLKHATPLYTSQATIYITPSSGIRLLNDTLGSAQRSNYLYTQCSLITTTPILQMVMDQPGIKDLPTFERYPNADPILYLQKQIETDVGRRDDFITISISTPYPGDSQMIIQAVEKAYMDYSSQEKRTSTSNVLDALTASLKDETTRRDDLRNQVAKFVKDNPTYNFDTIYQGQLGQVLAAYTQAQMATVEAKATWASGHPNVQKAEMAEEMAYEQWQNAQKQAISTNRTAAEYQLHNAQLQDKEAFVKQLQQRIDELSLAQHTEQILNTVQEMEPPRLADAPSYPRKYRVTGVAILLGGMLGAGLALLRDRSDGRMRSVEEMQGIVGLPILGVVPVMSGRRTAVARAMTVHLDPRSVVAEAYRTIRTAIYFGLGGNGNGGASSTKTILVTSPEPGDGKTTSASNLAIAIAQTGRSVLLLDADFRKPSQHKNLEIKNAVGLSSVLAGTETLERAVQRTGVDGLDILPCGPIPANPSEILNSREFGELVDTLASRYDHILFDSPPVNAVTDARILGAVCDATILVLRADKSTRKSGEHARNALLAVGARMLGAIVNDASKRKGYEVYGGSYYGSPDTGIVPSARRVTNGATAARAEQYEYVDPDEAQRVPPTRRRNIA